MAQISWQLTITTAGTEVTGPDTGAGTFQISPVPTNTGTYCYVGNDGSNAVSSTTGYVIKKDSVPLVLVSNNLNKAYFDSDTNGDKVMIIKIGGEQHGMNPPAI